ncbi:MAG TPA: GH92 family glycosyl hydrolase [Candidatus Baltobacteraceae bacterium]|jgi:predicted alpha-1,2-mannosidase|nr:GH92 family glycosyl hydrolase [Candidatus Baltobacteraceae bacterium]
MKFRYAAPLSAALLICSAPVAAAPFDNPVSDVNTFIGTTVSFDGTDVVDDFPGADVPFGMVQWSPDTPSQNAGGGYEYQDKQITGFSLTHLAGPGCNVFGDFGILPAVGTVTQPAKASQPFSHLSERAAPGYYEVTVGTNAIRTQLTVTKRTGLGAFTFPATTQANVLFNASSDQSGVDDASLRIIGNNAIEGSATTGHFCGMPDIYKVYFVAQFDRPFADYGTWKNADVSPHSLSSTGAGTGGWVTFDTTQNPVVRVKVGLSFVDYGGARANLRAENNGWDLEAVRNNAVAAWQDMLQRVAVTGGTPAERAIFYTALYHVLLHPNVESDVTGLYPGFDGTIHHVRPGHAEYANFSGWDIYRTQAPLMALVAPREASDAGQSLVDAAQQSGWLPKWSLVNGESAVMAGDPSDTILASYYAFGARDFDLHGALRAMIKGSSLPGGPPGQGWYPERPGIVEYVQRGYVTNTHMTNVSPVPNGASETEEYAVADFSIAQFAKSLHDMPVYHRYLKRSQNWANVFDTVTGYMAGRDRGGAFMQTPITDNGQSGFQEGNSAQYTWMVPQDFADLVRGIGGPQATAARLDAYFSQLNAGQDKPYAWLGNEPSIIDPFAYLALGVPARQESIVRKVQLNLWSDTPQGQGGNDDLGTMSAWYVWSGIGLYPVNPAVRGFAITTPLFKHVTIRVPGAPQIDVDAPGASDAAPYVESLRVNGKPWNRSWIELPQHGGLRMQFSVGDSDATTWASHPGDGPPSYRETPVTFPAATAATIRTPASDVAIAAGASAAIRLTAAVPQSAAGAQISWHAAAPPGVHMRPDNGTVALVPGAPQTVSAVVTIDPGQRAGFYAIPITATAADGAMLPVSSVALRIPGEDPPIFVADQQDAQVTPVDPETHAAGMPIAVGKSANALALSPDRRRMYVLNADDNTMSVVDTSIGSTVQTVAVAKGIGGMLMSPDGKTLWLSNPGESSLQPLDTGSMRAGKAVKLAVAPGPMAITPDGSTLYYSDLQDGSIIPFDTRKQAAGTPLAVAGHPDGLTISHDGTKLYVSEPSSRVIIPLNLASGTALAPIPTGIEPRTMAISPDGRTGLVSNYFAGTVTQIDLTTGTVVRTISAGGGTGRIAFSNDGKTAFVVAHEDQVVVPIDVSSGSVGTPIPVGVGPGAIAGP